MWSVEAYAQQSGISARAVRFRIHAGSLSARKVAGTWVVEEEPKFAVRRPAGRKMSEKSFGNLAAYLEHDDAVLSADERRRASQRARRLRVEGLPLLRHFADRSDLVLERYRGSAEDIEELRGASHLAFTGVSHPDAEVYGPVVDAYVDHDLRDQVTLFHMLEPVVPGEETIRLRVQESVPRVRRLHVIADLLDDCHPRSQAEAQRLFDHLMSKR